MFAPFLLPLRVNLKPCALLKAGIKRNAEFTVAVNESRKKLNATNGGEYVIPLAGNRVKSLAIRTSLLNALGSFIISKVSFIISELTL